MIINSTKENIRVKVKSLLKKRFSDSFQKQQIKENVDTIRIACPLCGDSSTDHNKKRGNIYLDSGFYHCYNCGKHRSVINLFKSFKEDLELKDKIEIQKVINLQAKNKLNSYNLDFDRINKLGISKDYLMKTLKLKPYIKSDSVIKKRLLSHKLEHLAYNYKNHMYIFNLINDKVIGFQIRKEFKNKKYFDKYPLSRIYSDIIKKPLAEDDLKYDKISLIYNFFDLDFNRPVTVFESAFDSWFCKNSIGQSSVNVKFQIIENYKNSRYFFDNDTEGRKKMRQKLKEEKYVFQWEKFIKDFKIKGKIKDLNDVAIYFNKTNQIKNLLEIDKYFTNNRINILYV